jgi:predicted  nucleic acid-binding Zn-ribbon protein
MGISMIRDPVFVQATTTQLQSELHDLKNRLDAQEIETQKANSKFEFSVAEQEKLKSEFDVEKKAWAEEKTALTQRAETAEKALEEVTTELSGLKRHVSQMVSAIFGKSPCKCYILNLSNDHVNCD